jgi:hypothetical protein
VTHVHRREGEIIREWKAARLDIKVRRVCAECNNGWMNRLERTARPLLRRLIRGDRDILLPPAQKVIATWAVKTALMCEFIEPRTREAPLHHFETIYGDAAPPASSQVWLAAYNGPKEIDYNHRQLRLTLATADVETLRGYLAAFVLNHLVILVQGFEREAILDLAQHAQRGAFQIQPLKNPVTRWPPDIILNDEGVQSFLLMTAPEKWMPET